MMKEAIFHKTDSEYIYALSKDKYMVKLRTKKNDVRKINILYYDRFNYPYNNISAAEMQKKASDELFDYHEAAIDVGTASIGYVFELFDGIEKIYYGNYIFSNEFSTEMHSVFMMPAIAEKDIFVVPGWARESIVYQIFPERFHNGDPSNDPPNTQPWDSDIADEGMLGGDLQGIIDSLDYIEELGADTIYLTPIFEADTSHKYNTFDYFKIDKRFGTLDTLRELVKQAHKRNMRIILDAVFNHCGLQFPPFRDAKVKGERSRYKDWFDFGNSSSELDLPADYRTFGYVASMPKLMTKNEATAEYLMNVATYWIKEADIDGWRLDVADEVDHHFWREFRKTVKKVKPDALIVGEVWYDGRSWLNGDQFDTVMNYIFRDALERFIALESLTVEEFDSRLGFIRGAYKAQAYDLLWNLISTHDTVRFLYAADGEVRKLELAVLVQMTFTGVPTIYYGDEVGMTGGKVPECRRGMVWDNDKQNRELLDFYKRLISLRKKYKALQMGDFKVVCIDNDRKIYGYQREYNGQRIKVFLNNGRDVQRVYIPADSACVYDEINNAKYQPAGNKIGIDIGPKSGVLLVESKGDDAS